ncbi:MAG: hypothetical protein ACT4QF_00385 [Sporichthyaceae bacterium]
MAVFSTYRVPVDVVGRSRRRRLTRRVLLADLAGTQAGHEPCEDCAREDAVRVAVNGVRARRSAGSIPAPRWY